MSGQGSNGVDNAETERERRLRVWWLGSFPEVARTLLNHVSCGAGKKERKRKQGHKRPPRTSPFLPIGLASLGFAFSYIPRAYLPATRSIGTFPFPRAIFAQVLRSFRYLLADCTGLTRLNRSLEERADAVT
ncbi:hypothetical protein F5884DRAFT_854739 [Xylogone sp. PMI_703]|nr:hypothetical protein F5884DRAFT_854739 [Xylogone sp. PMI_703]